VILGTLLVQWYKSLFSVLLKCDKPTKKCDEQEVSYENNFARLFVSSQTTIP